MGNIMTLLRLKTVHEVHTSSLSVPNSSAYTQFQIRSMSSQSVTMPCSMGYLIFRRPLNSCARLPIKTSPSNAPAMTRTCLGRPTLWQACQWSGSLLDYEPNRGDAQRREKAFRMILASKPSFDSARALSRTKLNVKSKTLRRGARRQTLSITTG